MTIMGKVIRFPIERTKPKAEPTHSVFFDSAKEQADFEEGIIYLIRDYGEMTMRQILEHFPHKTTKVVSAVNNLRRTNRVWEIDHNIFRAKESDNDDED